MRTLLFLFVALLGFSSVQAQTAEELMQQALRLERSQGDYSGAIALYKQVSETAGVERRLAGKALVQMARAYENMGRSEAAGTYQRVLADYGDLPELAAEAREGFARTHEPVNERTAADPLSRKLVSIPRDLEIWGSALSPSGQLFVAASEDNLYLRVFDLNTGQERHLNVGEEVGFAQHPRFSPDESQIAVGWMWRRPENGGDIRVVDVETGEISVALDVTAFLGDGRPDDEWIDLQVYDWSRDGSLILAHIAHWAPTGGPQEQEYRSRMVLAASDGSGVKATIEVDDLAWEQACLTSDGRFALVDIKTAGPNGEERWRIDRLDFDTGMRIPWRSADGIDFRLRGCPWDTDQVLYSSAALGSQTLRHGSAEDPSSFDDPPLTHTPEESYAISGSKRGDVGMVLNDTDRRVFVMGVGPAGEVSAGLELDIETAGLATMSWHPSARKLAFVDAAQMSKAIGIYDLTTRQRETFPTPQRVLEVNWLTDETIAFGSPLGATDAINRYEEFLLDPEAASTSATGATEILEEEGIKGRWYTVDGKVAGWSAVDRCIYEVILGTRAKTPMHCYDIMDVESVILARASGGKRFTIIENRADAIQTLGLLDNGAYRSLGELPGPPPYQVLWVGDEQFLLAHRESQWGPIRELERVNVSSGKREGVFESLLAEFEVGLLVPSPDGKEIAVTGWTKSDDEYRLTIVQNALGR